MAYTGATAASADGKWPLQTCQEPLPVLIVIPNLFNQCFFFHHNLFLEPITEVHSLLVRLATVVCTHSLNRAIGDVTKGTAYLS